MNARLFLAAVGWGFGLVAWQTFLYPPDYLLAATVWGVLAALGAIFCLVASVCTKRGVALIAGIACICHALGRASAVIVQVTFDNRFELGAPFSNYAVAATVWSLMALTLFVSWSHFVIPWSALRRVDRGGA